MDVSARTPDGKRYYNSQRGGKRSGRHELYPAEGQVEGAVHNFQGARKTGEGYDLNFSNVDLGALSKAILKDTLNATYIHDPRVRGRVTLSTGGKISEEELLLVFEAILNMNNGALIKEQGFYKIVPKGLAQVLGGTNVHYANEKNSVGPGYGITILPLKYISADSMMNMLKSFSSNQNGMKANIIRNVLFIRGNGRSRSTLLNIARTFDVDWMRGQSAGIYRLRNTSPEEIIPELEDVFRSKKGLGKGILKFRAIGRLNAVLVLTQKSHILNQVQEWVFRLDRTNPEAESLFVYKVENGKAKELAKILNRSFTGSAGSSEDTSQNQVTPDQEVKTISSKDNKQEQESQTSQQTSNGTRSSSTRIGSVRITADEINNNLLIRASGRDYRKIVKILRRIDRPPLQVLINATLAEVTLNEKLKYGVQFFLKNKKGGISFSTGNAVQIAANQFPGLNFIIGSLSGPNVVLDALSSETNVKVVSSPSVVVLHNQTAKLQVGDEVPIATRQVSDTKDSQAPVINEIKFRNTGVILKVTPRVNSNGLVTMEIEQEISSVTSANSVGENGTLTPTISQRKIQSTIAVNSQQTVVLGGLISEQVSKDNSGIPGLRRVPIIGKLVGADNDNDRRRTELVVFLQPTVIRTPQDAADIAENIRDNLMSLSKQANKSERLPVDHRPQEKSFK